MDQGERDSAIDAVITVLVDVIEDTHELAVAAWPTTDSDAHERMEQLIAVGREYVTLSEALRVIQVRFEKAEA